MKTPREILLKQHPSAGEKLDDVRANALAAAFPKPARPAVETRATVPWLPGGASALWRELIRPCRFAWTGIALVWIGIVAINAQLSEQSGTLTTSASASAPVSLDALKEQRRILAELAPPAPVPAAPPRHRGVEPRSDRSPVIVTI